MSKFPPKAADLQFLQRFRSKDKLLLFLTTRLAHENAIRQTLWGLVRLYLFLLIAIFGLVHYCLLRISVADTGLLRTIGLILCVGLILATGGVCIYLVFATSPSYKAVLYRGGQIASWWYAHYDKIKDDEDARGALDRHETAVLTLNVLDAADTLHEENRRRNAAMRRIRFLVICLLAGLIPAYCLALTIPPP